MYKRMEVKRVGWGAADFGVERLSCTVVRIILALCV